jgi:hypothetical protein
MRTFLAAALLFPSLALAAPGPAQAKRLVSALLSAVGDAREADALDLCTPAFRDRDHLSCARLVTELLHGPAAVHVTPASYGGDGRRGVATLWAQHEDKVLTLWLVAERTAAGWRFTDGGDGEGEPPAGFELAPLELLPGDDSLTVALRALSSGDGAAIAAASSLAMQEAEYDGVASIVAQLGQGLHLVPVAWRVGEDQGVATFDVLHGSEPVDRVYVYLDRPDERWLISGIDESESHVHGWLNDTLPARVDPGDWEDDAEADRLFDLVTRATAGEAQPGIDPWPETTAPATLERVWHHRPPRLRSSVRETTAPATLERVWAKRLSGTDRYAICGKIGEQTAYTVWKEDGGSFTRVSYGFTLPGECRVTAADLGE